MAGIGREVADAYISVHGDLSQFRKDLDKAGGYAAEQAAMANADKFADAWGKRITEDVNNRWGSIVDAMYSDKKLDWDRLVGTFDPNGNLDEAQRKILAFTDDMAKAGKLSTEEQEKFNKALQGTLGIMREEQQLRDRMDEQARRHNELMDKANTQLEAYKSTLSGMRNLNAISNLEKDFAKLAETMNSADMEDFAKSFDSLEKARSRVYDVTQAMREQNRLTFEQAQQIQANINAFIDGEKAKAKAMRDALDETNRLRKAQDDYNASLSGMARNIHFGKLENDFRNLAAAMDSNDFSHFARGARNIREMRSEIASAANEMHRLGRMTDEEYLLVLQRTRDLTGFFRDGDRDGARFFTTLRNGANRAGTVFSRLNTVTRGFREHLQGFAGLNVFGDMIRSGLDFIHNLDRIALSGAKVSMVMGTLASVGGASLAGLVTIAADLGAVIGGLAVAAPAFLIGTGIGVGVLVAAFKDTKTVLKDLKKPLAQFQDSISSDFWKQAAQPIRDMTKYLLPILNNPKGTSTATSLGKVFASLANSIKDIPADKLNFMFDNMNHAIDGLAGAMPPLIRAFTNLGMVGSKYFGRFSTWLVKLSDDFDKFIQKAFDNGDLDKWIENMIKGFKDLGRVLDGTFGIFNAINTAARAAGSKGLSGFADNLQRIAAVMQAPAFQKSMTILLEGMFSAVSQIGRAIGRLGPALQSLMPTLKVALANIGSAVALVIDHVGQILANPAVQQGIRDFTGSMVTALAKLEPAMKPFGDSLGSALTMLGKVLESVGQITAAFFIDLGPVLDSMSTKMSTLIQPFSDSATNFISQMKGPLKALDEQFVTPLVAAFKDKLLPAVDDFVNKFAPFAEKVIRDLAPSFKIIVEDVLPNFVRLASELLDPLGKIVDLLSPTLATTLGLIGDGFRNLASDIKVFKGELPVTELSIFKPFNPETAKKNVEDQRQQIADFWSGTAKEKSWGTILSNAFWGQKPDAFWADVYTKISWKDSDTVKWNNTMGKALEGARSGVGDLLQGFGSWWDGTIGKWWDDTIGGWWDRNVGAFTSNPSDAIAKGFENDKKNIGKALDDFGKWWDKTVGEVWKGIQKGFQDGFRGLFGFGKDSSKPDNGAVIGGSGVGGKGMGVSGELDPAMFGLPDKAGAQNYFRDMAEEFGRGAGDIVQGFVDGFASTPFIKDITDKFTTWIEDVKTFFGIHSPSTLLFEMAGDIVAGFINGFAELAAKVVEVWDAVKIWITTKAAEIKLAIDTWAADIKLNWDNFWQSVSDKVAEIWDAVKLWIDTKAAEIKLAIDTWVAGVKLGWDTFWQGVHDKVVEIWDAVKLWIDTKAAEIKLAIDTWAAGVKLGWDNFWQSVSDKVTETWNAVTGWINTKVGEIRGNIDRFISDVRTNWDNFWETVKRKVTDAWEGLKSGVSAGIEAVVQYFREMPTKITGQFSNMWGEMSRIGESIWKGLKSGIEGGIQWVKDAAANLASNAVAAAQAALEVNSPSKKFRRLGLSGGEGMAQGFDWSGGLVAKASGAMADTAVAAFAHSKMYLAGADAALGLAAGLKDNKGVVAGALGAIIPAAGFGLNLSGTVSAAGAGVPTPGNTTIVNINEGAIPISTPTKSPDLVASKVIDGFATYSRF